MQENGVGGRWKLDTRRESSSERLCSSQEVSRQQIGANSCAARHDIRSRVVRGGEYHSPPNDILSANTNL